MEVNGKLGVSFVGLGPNYSGLRAEWEESRKLSQYFSYEGGL